MRLWHLTALSLACLAGVIALFGWLGDRPPARTALAAKHEQCGKPRNEIDAAVCDELRQPIGMAQLLQLPEPSTDGSTAP